MATTDFSISPSTFCQFGWAGWSEAQQGELYSAINAIPGVTKQNLAGGGETFHVHFDPAIIKLQDLITAVAAAADQVMPGHNFSQQ